MSATLALFTAPAFASPPIVPDTFSQKHKPPTILAIDGMDLAQFLKAVAGAFARNADYLRPALGTSENISRLGVKPEEIHSVPWSGDVLADTDTVLKQIKGTVELLVKKATKEGRAFVIVGHSWGTVLAYRALSELEAEKKLPAGSVALLLTMGSPLGDGSSLAKQFARQGQTITKPASVSTWSNWWSGADGFLSGPIPVASNVELPSVQIKDHSAYYQHREFLETIGADIAVAVTNTMARVPPVATPTATHRLRSLAGQWHGITSGGSKFAWTIAEDGRYVSEFQRSGRQIKREGKIWVGPGSVMLWRAEVGQTGTLKSIGEGVLRGTIAGRPETFDLRQVTQASPSAPREPPRVPTERGKFEEIDESRGEGIQRADEAMVRCGMEVSAEALSLSKWSVSDRVNMFVGAIREDRFFNIFKVLGSYRADVANIRAEYPQVFWLAKISEFCRDRALAYRKARPLDTRDRDQREVRLKELGGLWKPAASWKIMEARREFGSAYVKVIVRFDYLDPATAPIWAASSVCP
jgi:pimeloyl-ACP methyl ester carboxylesterase